MGMERPPQRSVPRQLLTDPHKQQPPRPPQASTVTLNGAAAAGETRGRLGRSHLRLFLTARAESSPFPRALRHALLLSKYWPTPRVVAIKKIPTEERNSLQGRELAKAETPPLPPPPCPGTSSPRSLPVVPVGNVVATSPPFPRGRPLLPR
ncbi:actin-binding protein WASF3-like [Rhea pennata]|uniref:actin-binding protein WASF3-like n=1 Tax=Rhea pennata TaxID=8795 RepID=UPI002E268B19